MAAAMDADMDSSYSEEEEDADAVMNIIPDKDLKTITKFLKKHKSHPDRLNYVCNLLLSINNDADDNDNGDVAVPNKRQRSSTEGDNNIITIDDITIDVIAPIPAQQPQETPDDDIFEAVTKIMAHFPDANPDLVYQRLELALERGSTLMDESQKIAEELVVPDPDVLARNVRTDLEVANNVEVGTSASEKINDGKLVVAVSSTQNGVEQRFLSESETETYKGLLQMFPDIDPQYIVEQIAVVGRSFDFLIEKFTTDDSLPTRRERLKKERLERRRAELLDPSKFVLADFLLTFPDPAAYFSDITRQVSALYVEHAKAQLIHEFPLVREDYIEQQLQAYNNHYLPARKQLIIENVNAKADLKAIDGRKKGCALKRREYCKKFLVAERPATVAQWPKEIEELFFRELQFTRNELNIQQYMVALKQNRHQLFSQAREAGTLKECPICVEEILASEMVSCGSGSHSFCKTCIRQHADTMIGGEGKATLACMFPGCEAEFKFEVLRKLLSCSMQSLLLRRQAESNVDGLKEAIMQGSAGNERLESCPFCPFTVILESAPEQDRVFHCQNPDCLQDSCRLCRNASHIPLRCDEINRAELERFVENQMAEAMIRQCPKCKTRVIKESGCNHMTCSRCSTHFCYLCNEQMPKQNPYAHFNNGKCQPHSNDDDLHGKQALRAGAEALEKFKHRNPNAKIGDVRKVDINSLVDKQKDAGPGMNVNVGLQGLHRAVEMQHHQTLIMHMNAIGAHHAEVAMNAGHRHARIAAPRGRGRGVPRPPDAQLQLQQPAFVAQAALAEHPAQITVVRIPMPRRRRGMVDQLTQTTPAFNPEVLRARIHQVVDEVVAQQQLGRLVATNSTVNTG